MKNRRREIIIELQITTIRRKGSSPRRAARRGAADVAGVAKSVVSRNPFLDDGKTHKTPSRWCMYLLSRGHSSRCTPPVASSRGSHDGGRSMQIREINARKFHYNSARKISSSSCYPLFPYQLPSARFPVAYSRVTSPFSPPLSGRQEHPHYLVLPHSPRKMARKATGKTSRCFVRGKMAPTLEYISPSLPGEALLFVSWIPCAIRDSIIDRTAFLVVDRSSRRPLDPTAREMLPPLPSETLFVSKTRCSYATVIRDSFVVENLN